jgi:hypothetical protein
MIREMKIANEATSMNHTSNLIDEENYGDEDVNSINPHEPYEKKKHLGRKECVLFVLFHWNSSPV